MEKDSGAGLIAKYDPNKHSLLKLPKWNPKQLLAFNTDATDLLFGGATRGGKSFFVRKALIKWCTLIPGLQTDIFRLHFDDVIAENMEGETSFPMLLSQWERDGHVKINQTEVLFWNGSAIYLEHASNPEKVRQKHQGIARHVRVFSESTQIAEGLIRWLTAWVTMSEEMLSRVPDNWKGCFPKVIHVTNPIGPSAPYYRRKYVDAAPEGTIFQVGPWKRQYIEARVDDNPHEDKARTIARLGEVGDTAVADALINANWDALIGEYFTMWDEDRHVVADFIPPKWWFRYRSMDIGWSEPTAVYWIAISDGEPFRDQEGNELWFPRGARIFYNEWYICDTESPARGLNFTNEDIARGILERSEYEYRNVPTLTDSKPFQTTGGETPARQFAKCGVTLTQVDTGPGSRVAGWSIVKSALTGVVMPGTDERYPMVYFCECCHYARQYIPALPRHPSESKKEDAAESGEATHAPDAVRYGLVPNAIVKDTFEPLESKIRKEIRATRPTVQKFLQKTGMGSIFTERGRVAR